jgi:hypothetical protein
VRIRRDRLRHLSCDVPMSSHRPKSDPVAPFHVVLDGLLDQADVPRGTDPGWRSAPACDWTPLGEVAAPVSSSGAAEQMYRDADITATTPDGAPWCVDEAVALELQLSDDLQPGDLERIRRIFAYRNHPDRVGIAYKAHALQRMTVANVLIDQALKAARARAR